MHAEPKSLEPVASLVSLNKSPTLMAIPVTKSPLEMATHAQILGTASQTGEFRGLSFLVLFSFAKA